MKSSLIKRITTQHDNESFSAFIFRQCMLANIMAGIFIFFYAICFMNLQGMNLLKAILLTLLVTVLDQILIAPFTNHLVVKDCSDTIERMKDDPKLSTISSRTNLALKLLKMPQKKGAEIYIHFALCGITCAWIYHFVLGLNAELSMTISVICCLTSYIATVISYSLTEKYTYIKLVSITAQGIDKNLVESKKVLGTSMPKLLVTYVILPTLFSFAITVIMLVLKNINMQYFITESKKSMTIGSAYISPEEISYLKRIIFICLCNIANVSILALIFFRRIKIYTTRTQEALLSIDSLSTQNKTDPIPYDLDTELSYTSYMVNKTIELFYSIMEETIKINDQIKNETQDLSSIAQETSATSLTQSSAVKEILTTMNLASEKSASIDKRIEEVNTVATKTNEYVNYGFEAVKENTKKMQEIVLANETSLNGIRNLYNKTNSIWDIVNLIDGVADQTKIIAFNAELEAENVAEGKQKFKNVASDIRALADNVINLTKEIRTHIQEIKISSNDLIKQGNECSVKIAEGKELTNSLEEKFMSILDSAKMTSASAGQIKDVIKLQTESFEEIKNKLEQITAGVENFSDSTAVINENIQRLTKDSQYLSTI